MSRHKITAEGGIAVFYGLDHAIGYFCDVIAIVDDEDDVREELCNAGPFRNCNRMQIVEVLKKYGAPEDHINRIAMDLPI